MRTAHSLLPKTRCPDRGCPETRDAVSFAIDSLGGPRLPRTVRQNDGLYAVLPLRGTSAAFATNPIERSKEREGESVPHWQAPHSSNMFTSLPLFSLLVRLGLPVVLRTMLSAICSALKSSPHLCGCTPPCRRNAASTTSRSTATPPAPRCRSTRRPTLSTYP